MYYDKLSFPSCCTANILCGFDEDEKGGVPRSNNIDVGIVHMQDQSRELKVLRKCGFRVVAKFRSSDGKNTCALIARVNRKPK